MPSEVRLCESCNKAKKPDRFYKDHPHCLECMKPFSVESIRDFQTCALLYDYRYRQEMYEPLLSDDALDMKWENTIKKMAAFYFFKKQGGITPSAHSFLTRWERFWYPKDTTAWDIVSESHSVIRQSMHKLSVQANGALLSFYEFWNDWAAWDPLLVNEPFLVPLGEPGMNLTGTYDLVLRNARTKEILIVKWLARHQRINKSSLLLDMAALKLAWDSRGLGSRTKYAIYNFASAAAELSYLEVKDQDVSSLLYWIQEAWTSDHFVPRRGFTTYCKRCPFDKPCADFEVPREALSTTLVTLKGLG